MKKRTGIIIAGTLVVVALVALLSTDRSPAPSGPEPVSIGYLPIVASLPIFVAAEEGLFAKHGLEADLKPFTDSNTMLNALVAGQLDALPAVSLVPILHLELQYPNTVSLFSHSRMQADNAFDAIIALESSPIDSLDDLAGRRIGVFPGTSATNMLKAYLRQIGVDPSRIQFVPLPPPAQLTGLSSGGIDALFTYEPVTTAAEVRGGFKRVFGSVYAAMLTPNPIGASVLARRLKNERSEVAERVQAAINEAVLFMRNNPGQAATLLTKWAKIEPEIAARVHFVDVTVGDELDVTNLQTFADLLVSGGELPRPLRMTELVR